MLIIRLYSSSETNKWTEEMDEEKKLFETISYANFLYGCSGIKLTKNWTDPPPSKTD